jgi:uncharacterized protein (DUF885 family)
MRKSLLAVGFILAVAGCSRTRQAAPPAAFHALLDEAWRFQLQEDPLFATWVGERRWNDRLPSVTAEDERRRADFSRALLERLKSIDPAALGSPDRISYQMFERQLEDALADFEFKGFYFPITVDDGFHIAFARLPSRVPLETAEDYQNYLARLKAFPEYVAQHIALMREGLGAGYSLPRVIFEGYEVTIASHLVDDPTRSVFYSPFQRLPARIAESERERWIEAGKTAVAEAVVPAYRRFLDFMVNEYLPKARTSIGASELPHGREYYAHLIRRFTTLDLTADQVHQRGLDEVARIRAEMNQVIREVGFTGDFPAFLKFLRTDSRFYARTPEQLLKEAAWIAKRMDGKLPSLFKTLPRLPYGIEPVPAHLAPKYTGGRYVGPAQGSTEAGYYWVNTYALASRPLYTLESLTLHEAVPGHHLQNALARELSDLPPFRRFTNLSAFGEGWGLYSERLGLEAGFYTDPYSNFGRLTYEMWRACRLVVDSGMHAKGWTREQARDFLASNTALSLHEIRTETDRYISWPGQALAYKIGELTIRELRAKAERELGERFDVREFHDLVLGNGPVPLPVLETQVNSFIAEQKAHAPPS